MSRILSTGGKCVSQHALGVYIPACTWLVSVEGVSAILWDQRQTPPGLEADPPQKTATAADGTHSTGFLDGVSIKEEEKGIIVKEKALPFKKRHSLSIKWTPE